MDAPPRPAAPAFKFRIAGDPATEDDGGFPLWELGFRPFFLLGMAAAVLLLALWVGFLSGWVPPPAMDPIVWHGHEMVYGFTVAIIAGFLLTASQNWTGMRGVHGWRLQLLVGLWLLGRVACWLYSDPRWLAAVVDLALLPTLGVFLAPYLLPGTQRRNRVFFLFLGLLTLGNGLVHAEEIGWLEGSAGKGLWLGVYTILLILVLIGGRVVPFFTRNALPEAAVRTRPLVERASLVTAAVLVPAAFLDPQHPMTGIIAGAAAVAHGARLAGWTSWTVTRRPIVWILHLGYGWLVVGFALMAVLPRMDLPVSSALHAFTAGGMGVMIYGMISRIALGHTGRPIVAAPVVVLGYGLINGAALARVAGPLLAPAYTFRAFQVSGVLWMAAFLLLLGYYAPILLRPRA